MAARSITETQLPMKSIQGTRGEVLRLSLANAFEAGLRLLVPMVLVRLISPTDFGQYRLFWLVGNSLTLLLPMGMVRSLLYFLPRSEPVERAAFVSQTIMFLSIVSLPVAAALASGESWLPDQIRALTERDALLGAFAFLWVVSSIILTLPNADGDIRWQARAIICLSLLRAVLITATAWFTRDLESIFIALLFFAAAQMVLLVYYGATRYGSRLQSLRWAGMRRQMKFAFPFGLSGILAQARGRIEQWLVVGFFIPEALAMFAIAGSFNSILRLLRKSVGNVLIPKMSKTHATGDVSRSLELNNRGNLVICFLVYPAVVYIWLFAAPLVEVLFTDKYLEAVPIIRVYSLAMILMSVELATVLIVYEQGSFVAKVSAGVLLASAVLSYAGAMTFGLPGVALGGLVGTLVTRLFNFRRAAFVMQIPFGRLQDWSTLGRLLSGAVVSGLLVWLIDVRYLGDTGPFVTLIAVGAMFVPLIFGFAYLFGTLWICRCMLGRERWPERELN